MKKSNLVSPVPLTQSTIAEILAIFIGNDLEHYSHVAVMMLWGLGLGACGFRGVAGYLGAKCAKYSHGLVKLGLGGLSWWVYDKRVGGVLRLVRNVGGMFASCCFSALYSWKRCKAGPELLRQETNHMKVSLRNITTGDESHILSHVLWSSLHSAFAAIEARFTLTCDMEEFLACLATPRVFNWEL